MISPENLIKSLKNTDPYIATIYTEGSCYQLYLFLKDIYPQSIPYINNLGTHIATSINGVLYDINGVVESDGWCTMEDGDVLEAETWSFSKKAYLQIGECPVCEEPLINGYV